MNGWTNRRTDTSDSQTGKKTDRWTDGRVEEECLLENVARARPKKQEKETYLRAVLFCQSSTHQQENMLP